jgi:hypothetical protein
MCQKKLDGKNLCILSDAALPLVFELKIAQIFSVAEVMADFV